ncbi:MFS transporter [Variovorax guangxiensis]|uniref:MFS transporter n=1 Tax=Variovorax guangxiensis TaxID=1775474 RepID=UPI002861071B|nr:MFS transporter [Variovorax guangxiensis]MDR6858521.1 MFS family permease [Variovorax guangxiensis]
MTDTTVSPSSEPAPARGSPGEPYDLRHGLACALAGTLCGLTQGFGLYLVSSNLPGIQGSLGATAAEAGWLTTAYFSTALWSTLLLVKVRLQFGIRLFTSLGLLCFVLVAGLHLTTNTLTSAVVVRAALGIAAAPLSTLAVLYWREALPKKLVVAGLLIGFATLQVGMPLSRVISPHLLEIGQWHGLFLIDVALAVLSFAAIHAVSLVPAPRQKAFSPGDLVSFPLYATGVALLCIVVSQGRIHWWRDAPWLGVCLAAAIGCTGLYVAVELQRKNPLLDLRWLASPYMLRFVIAVLLFRIVLSEQSVGITGLMSVLGQSNEQMQLMFALAGAATFGGFLIAIPIAARGGTYWLGLISLALIAGVAWHDSGATSLTRPVELYVSQALLPLALALFFSGSCLLGFGPVIADGGRRLVSFLAAFSGAQYMGSLLGTAWVSTTVADRQTWHYAALVQHLPGSDPQVAARVAQLGASVGRFVNDPAARANQGLTLLTQQVTRESFVLAYNDVFQYIAALAALTFVWFAVLTWRASRRQRAATTTPS